MYFKSIVAATAASLFASANAHFMINSPAPVPGSAIKDPLDASGDNFPCHGADLTQGSVTNLQAGTTQQLGFELAGGANTAVHGGGSCQISLTYETDPTALKDPANWKVIQSFVGGCPTNALGNLNVAIMCDGTNAPNCVNQLSFGIPAEVANGNAILAWTWFNNVGNREFYMNCAKVAVSGGSNQLDSLPGMAVANLASINSCTSTENFNVAFPDPGKYVTTESPLNYPTKPLQGSGCSGAASGNTDSSAVASPVAASPPTAGASGTVASPAAESPPTAGSGSTVASPAAANPPAAASSGSDPSNPGGVFAPGAASSPTATVVIATTFITSPAAPTATGTTGGSTGAADGSPGGSTGTTLQCTTGQVSCTASGLYCINSTTFGMCELGCATPMQVSAGTQCNNNAIEAATSSRRKRSARYFHARAAHNYVKPSV